MIVGGAGGGAGDAAGWGGELKSGSFTAFPSESYFMFVGDGGPGKRSPGFGDIPSGSVGTGSFISGSNTITPFFDNANGGRGGQILPNPSGAGFGNNGTGSGHNPSGVNGGDGSQWLDGKWYGGGGGIATPTPPGNGRGGRGGGANGGFSYNLTSYDAFGNNIFPTQIPNTNTGGGAGSTEVGPGTFTGQASGSKGIVALRYLGSPIATGGEIISSASYTYHYFTASATLDITLSDLLIYPGLPGIGGGGVTASNATANTGGGAGASFYFNSGSKGGSGFVAIRYEGAPIAEGGQITTTDHYTYHVYTASGDFYAIGNETNPNINPCP